MRISETPSPTDSQSPKFPNVALARRARILAFAFWSSRWDSQTSKSDDRSNVFKSSHCIRVDTTLQGFISDARTNGLHPNCRGCPVQASLGRGIFLAAKALTGKSILAKLD